MGEREQLEFMEWGPKAEAQRLIPPGMPHHFEIVGTGKGAIEFDWKPPAPQSGGDVRNYLVFRRDKSNPTQPFTPWQQIQSSLATTRFLTDQPRGIDLEYRVVAVNNAGNSVPSNTVTAVLE